MTDLDAFGDELHAILDRHHAVFTGAVVRIESPDLELEVSTGLTDPEDPASAVGSETPFDLASLTKIFTSTAILRLAAGDRVLLDAPVRHMFPAFAGPDKDRVTLRQLLTHSSGLPALIRLFGPDAPPDPWSAIFDAQLVREPGSQVEYSDIGFMLLGRVVEVVTGLPLDRAVRELVTAPLRLTSVSYGPRPEAVATEYDPWRGRRLRGEVHDENAAVLGGVAGHAGLFGHARDAAALAGAYLHPDRDFLPGELVREAVREQAVTLDQRRGLGWKLRSPLADAPDASFSADTFGHYGFTGTAVWADPAREVIVVLLANRVYFGREPKPIMSLRRDVFRAITTRVCQRL